MKTPELERAETETISAPTLNILHRGIGAGILAMAGVSVWLSTQDGFGIPHELSDWIFVFVAMSAGLHVLCLILLKQVLAHVANGSYQGYCILRWILVEGIAFYAMVAAGVGRAVGWVAVGFVLALWMMWSERPTEKDHELFLSQFR